MKNYPNLLIVDDSEENLLYIMSVVRKLKVNIIQAQSGIEALEKTVGIDLALAIIDVNMPEMNGYELAVKLNLNREIDKVPIVFLTASHVNEMQVFKGYGSGAVDYLIKPIDNNILLCKINVFLDLFTQKQTIIREAALLKKSTEELISVNAALKKSEQKYRSYVDNAPDGVFVADEVGRYIEVNDAACRMTGYSKAELLKLSITDLFTYESQEEGLEVFGKLIQGGQIKADLKYRHKNGTHRWWTVEAVRLTGTRFLGFAKDITWRKEVELSLSQKQVELEKRNDELNLSIYKAEVATRKYTELYDFAPSGYITLSAECKIVDLNHGAAQLLAMERSRLIDSHFGIFISISTLPVFQMFFQNVFISESKEVCEIIIESESHQQKYVHIEGVIAGNGYQCLLSLIDISSRKKAEDILKESEMNLSEAQRMAHIGSWQWNMLIDSIKWSDEMFRIFDIDPETFEGKPEEIMKVVHPEDIDLFVESMNITLNNGASTSLEYRIIHKDGSIRNVFADGRVELDSSGRPGRSIGTVQDVTDRRMAERAIKISEEKYKTMLNASPDGIILTDMKGVITEVSEIGLELLGAESKDDLVGKKIFHFVPADEKGTVREIIDKTMNDGLIQNIGIKIKKINQSIFAGETSATLIQGPDGSPLSLMIILRDISHRKKMETKQIHADRMANLGEMASGIAHEINQPLNIISMVMDKILFETAKTNTIDVEFLHVKSDKIFENILRIRNIIDHIRAFSRTHDDFVLTAFDINTSIANATSMIKEQFKHLGITLDLQLEKNLPTIYGNTYKFEQVIVNLLVNAKDAVIEMKNQEPGYAEMIVGIRSYQENQLLIVEVQDNGIGISVDDINNIILPFYTTKDEGKGTGIGLSICYQIMKEMNGFIDIASDKFKGTKVKLVIEIQKKKGDIRATKD